jgi:uncharacterized alpha-E superfamily protein
MGAVLTPPITLRRPASSMLSRVADNFYWLSRYLERADLTARLLEVNLELMPDQMRGSLERWQRVLDGVRVEQEDLGDDPAYTTTRLLAFDAENPDAVANCVAAVRTNARQVRQHISAEMFEHLNALYWRVRWAQMDAIWNDQPIEFFRSIQQAAHLFCGLSESTMDHGQEFFFMQLGRYIERAAATARLLDAHFTVGDESGVDSFEADDYLRWVSLLKTCTGFEAYLRSHHAEVNPRSIAQFLLLNATFPRSIRFCADRIVEALQQIGYATGGRRSEQLDRLAGRLQASLQFTYIDEIIGGGVQEYLADVERQCEGLSSAIYHAYISYPVEIPE